ncbi:copper resistance CopC family protein [Herbiconiux solani]|uniref:copper resistance CopC family protein n=1 Tax=Herbiconiux solani TaxID=661329 RepID=UPI0008251C07|nr:copper resistance CopC family protein [Herbiconiux solani]
MIAGAVVAALAGGALVLGSAGAASAHDYLVSTNPADGSTVTEPLSTVALTFNEPPLTQSGTAIAIEVHDAGGTNIASGPVSIVNSTLSIAVAPAAQGDYTVLWQTVSADGHPVSGHFAFTYAGPAGGSGAAAPGAGASTPAAGQDAGDAASGSGQAAGSPTATAGSGEPAGSGSGSGSDDASASGSGGMHVPFVLIGLGAAGGVIVIVAIVLVVGLRRRAR